MSRRHGSASVELSAAAARRIALAAQGFDRPRPARADTRHLRATVRRLGLVQIDSVNVLVPAHYLVLFSRVGPYQRSALDDLAYRRREIAESWAHAACLVPIEDWPLLRRRRDDEWYARWTARFRKQHPGYVEQVLDHLRAHGPLTAADLPDPAPRKRRGSWWDWSLAKTALEAHFALGTAAVAARREAGFARVYDVAERVIPSDHLRREVPAEEAHRQLLRRAAGALGVATAADLADYYRLPLRDVRRRLPELVEDGALLAARVEGWREPAYVHAAARPAPIRAAALLSPFDPVVWYRPRALRVFGFDYRIEIYTPAPKRRFGYYVLPFLVGDRLVARIDLKADRAAGRLLVQAAHLEPPAGVAQVAAPLAAELRAVADWLELEAVHIAARGPLARSLRRH